VQIIDVPDGLVAVADDYIAFGETRSLRGTAWLNCHDENPAFSIQVMKADDSPRQLHVLARDPEETATDLSILDQSARDELGRIDADRIMAVLTPMTSPCELTSGPPELPGFNAASV
jgi:hypothetical protein